ncbi:hypothetical protein BACERE00183_04109 [Bacillus cereus]|nr:hypothetical protein BACERE00183_04109 [Bacillus cereus]
MLVSKEFLSYMVERAGLTRQELIKSEYPNIEFVKTKVLEADSISNLNEIDSILAEAIQSLDKGESVNGLEWARELIRKTKI